VTYSADVAVTPTVTIDAVVEIQDAGQQLAEVSMGANGSTPKTSHALESTCGQASSSMSCLAR